MGASGSDGHPVRLQSWQSLIQEPWHSPSPTASPQRIDNDCDTIESGDGY